MLVYRLLKLLDSVLDRAERGTYKLADRIVRLIRKIRREVFTALSDIETRRLVEMIIKYESGNAESRYADPALLREELENKGFKEVFVDDYDTGYNVVLVNEELNKAVSITWKCITVRLQYLLLSWEPYSSALRKLAMRKLLKYLFE